MVRHRCRPPPTAAHGWTEVVNEWGTETQQRDDLLTELSNLDADNKPSRGLLTYSVPRPVGLSTSHDIDRLAIRFESFIEEFSNILQRQVR